MQRARPEFSQHEIVLLSSLLAYHSDNFPPLSFFIVCSAMLCDTLNLNEKLLTFASQLGCAPACSGIVIGPSSLISVHRSLVEYPGPLTWKVRDQR